MMAKAILPNHHRYLPSHIFESSSCVRAADYDGDGDKDLFVGVRLKPFALWLSLQRLYTSKQWQRIFTDVTEKVAPALKTAGMVTDAQWFDYDKDGKRTW